MIPKINIAIDGHSSCGKSTLAKDIAKAFSYIYIDSGAMYRAVALFCIQHNIDVLDSNAVTNILDKINIDFRIIKKQFRILLNNEDVTDRIIKLDVSNIVSEVAAISEVRKKLVSIQQDIGKDKGVVMDGRDIGTVVFPDAEVKLFVTAHVDIRSKRRFIELEQKKMPASIEDIRSNLLHRDHIDSTRADSPLVQAKDALLIDNSFMDRDEQLFIARKLIGFKINK